MAENSIGERCSVYSNGQRCYKREYYRTRS